MRQSLQPIGMEPVAVGVSADAHHTITPSIEGPKAAIRQALAEGNAGANDVGTWDLHTTATPGDYVSSPGFPTCRPRPVAVFNHPTKSSGL